MRPEGLQLTMRWVQIGQCRIKNPKNIIPIFRPCFLLFVWFISLISHMESLYSDIIEFRAEKVFSTGAEGREQTSLEGDVFVDVNNSSIQTDNLDIYGEDRDILIAKGSVLVDNHEELLTIKGRELFYNRTTKLLRMRGSIELEDRNNEVIVYCNFIEYNEETDIANLQISVRIFNEDITARSEYAVYNRESQILELSGSPIVYKEDDVYEASRIFVDLDTNDITLDYGVEGQIFVEDEEDEEG